MATGYTKRKLSAERKSKKPEMAAGDEEAWLSHLRLKGGSGGGAREGVQAAIEESLKAKLQRYKAQASKKRLSWRQNNVSSGIARQTKWRGKANMVAHVRHRVSAWKKSGESNINGQYRSYQ